MAASYINTCRGSIRYAFTHVPKGTVAEPISICSMTETEPFEARPGSQYHGLRGLELTVDSSGSQYSFLVSPILARQFKEDLREGYFLIGYFAGDRLSGIGFLPEGVHRP